MYMEFEQSTCNMEGLLLTTTEKLTMTPLRVPLQGVVDADGWQEVAQEVEHVRELRSGTLFAAAGIMIGWQKYFMWALIDKADEVYIAAQNVDGTVGHLGVQPDSQVIIGRQHNQEVFVHPSNVSRDHLKLYRPQLPRTLIVTARSPKNPTWLLFQEGNEES